VLLLSVAPDFRRICEYNSPGLTPTFQRERSAFCVLENQKKALLEAALKEGHRELVNAGFDLSRIETKLHVLEKGVARDIIKTADSGFDVVVIGRRGVSAPSAFLLGSVSQKVLGGVKKASVFVVS
jgi:nucleotide-binding universal stress UspA family protein